MNHEPRITTAEIVDDPLFGTGEPKIARATLDDGTTQDLFTFYSDELTFTGAELVGLTADEARSLHRRRDVEWLRS